MTKKTYIWMQKYLGMASSTTCSDVAMIMGSHRFQGLIMATAVWVTIHGPEPARGGPYGSKCLPGPGRKIGENCIHFQHMFSH